MKKPQQEIPSPADLLAAEKGAYTKPFGIGKSIALVYPNTYRVGMSNLGFQTLYRIFNESADICCERFFTDSDPFTSLENNRQLNDFDIIAFTCSFEMDYYNILAMLKRSGIPLKRKDRNEKHPLIIAGGAAIGMNCRPLIDFIDIFFIGEADDYLVSLTDNIHSLNNKNQIIEFSVQHEGIFIPEISSLESVKFHEVNLDNNLTYSQVLSPHTEFSDMFLIEVSRGCPYKCKFCYTGHCYTTFRVRGLNVIRNLIDTASTLAKKVGFVGSAIGAHPDMEAICEYALSKNLSISFSSIRINELTPFLLNVLIKSGQKTITLAPEAGSERLRKAIGKYFSHQQILDTAKLVFEHDILNLKLYFLAGLPGETDEDLNSIVYLVKDIREIMLSVCQPKGRMGNIVLDAGIFVPKTRTPYELEHTENIKTLKKKITFLRKNLNRIPNVEFRAESPFMAKVQEYLSNADSTAGETLIKALEADGNWKEVLDRKEL